MPTIVKIPIHGAFAILFRLFRSKKEQDFEQVVSVQANDDMKVIGHYRLTKCINCSDGFNDDDSILQSLRLLYDYAVLVPKSTADAW